MSLSVVSEQRTPRVIVRECDCGPCDCGGSCGERGLFATVPGAHESLWLTVVLGSREKVAEGRETLLCPDDMEAYVRLEQALALVGLPWVLLSRNAGWLQARAAQRLPVWMWRLPRGVLWMTRGATFGPELTRVPRALWALRRAYVPDGAAPDAGFDQPWVWGRQPVEGPALEPWS